jgi:hypothetical protein
MGIFHIAITSLCSFADGFFSANPTIGLGLSVNSQDLGECHG